MGVATPGISEMPDWLQQYYNGLPIGTAPDPTFGGHFGGVSSPVATASPVVGNPTAPAPAAAAAYQPALTSWNGPFRGASQAPAQTGAGTTPTTQTSNIASNTAAIPGIEQLTELVNSINVAAQQRANAGRIPGGAGLEGTSSANISRALGGELPPSVINQIGQRSAERGVGTGSPMGASSNAEYLRSIGLTSLDLENTGQSWLTAALGRNPAAPLFDPSKLIITPEQQAQIDLERERLAIARLAANRVPAGYGGGGGGFAGNRSADQSRSMNPYSPFLPTSSGNTGQTDQTPYWADWFDQTVFPGGGNDIPSGPSFDYNWEDFSNMV